MLSRLTGRLPIRRHAMQRAPYSTSAHSSSFYARFGPPIVKCTVIASATTMAFQLLWEHLEYQEYRDEADATIQKLEERLKSLEQHHSTRQQ